MPDSKFNNTVSIWITSLEQYNYRDLCRKPSVQSWSIGQVYMHLLNDTNYYIEQINICLSGNNNAHEEPTAEAKALLLSNEFPDEIIEGHPDNYLTPQPAGKEELMQSLLNLQNEMNRLEILISKSTCKGKTKHPGFNYLDAAQWFRLAEMHFRHHLRQKKRIDDFLKTTR